MSIFKKRLLQAFFTSLLATIVIGFTVVSNNSAQKQILSELNRNFTQLTDNLNSNIKYEKDILYTINERLWQRRNLVNVQLNKLISKQYQTIAETFAIIRQSLAGFSYGKSIHETVSKGLFSPLLDNGDRKEPTILPYSYPYAFKGHYAQIEDFKYSSDNSKYEQLKINLIKYQNAFYYVSLYLKRYDKTIDLSEVESIPELLKSLYFKVSDIDFAEDIIFKHSSPMPTAEDVDNIIAEQNRLMNQSYVWHNIIFCTIAFVIIFIITFFSLEIKASSKIEKLEKEHKESMYNMYILYAKAFLAAGIIKQTDDNKVKLTIGIVGISFHVLIESIANLYQNYLDIESFKYDKDHAKEGIAARNQEIDTKAKMLEAKIDEYNQYLDLTIPFKDRDYDGSKEHLFNLIETYEGLEKPDFQAMKIEIRQLRNQLDKFKQRSSHWREYLVVLENEKDILFNQIDLKELNYFKKDIDSLSNKSAEYHNVKASIEDASQHLKNLRDKIDKLTNSLIKQVFKSDKKDTLQAKA